MLPKSMARLVSMGTIQPMRRDSSRLDRMHNFYSFLGVTTRTVWNRALSIGSFFFALEGPHVYNQRCRVFLQLKRNLIRIGFILRWYKKRGFVVDFPFSL